MMRILHIAVGFIIGGTVKTMEITCLALQRSQRVQVSIGAWQIEGPRISYIKENFERVIFFNQNFELLHEYICENQIQIIHIHRSNDALMALVQFIKKSLPHIIVVETNAFGKMTGHPSESFIDYRLFVSKFCILRFQKKYQLFHEAFSRQNTLFYNPIYPEEFPDISPVDIGQFKKRLNIQKDDIVLGRIGRADNVKFGDMCIDMLPHLLTYQKNIKLILMAAPERVQKKIHRMGLQKKCIFLPESADPSDVNLFYKTVDILTHSSLIGESFGCSIAEAMYNKKPVVVNSTPYFDNAQIELVDNGATGYVVNNSKSFAEAVLDIVRHPQKRKAMSDQAYTKANNLFNIRNTIETLINMYDRMCMRLPLSTEIENFSDEYSKRLDNLYHPREIRSMIYALQNRGAKKYHLFVQKIKKHNQ